MKSNLLQFLFGTDLVKESGDALGEQVVRLFEEAAEKESVELVANKQPLQKVLKSLGIDNEIEPGYQWAEIRCKDLGEYRAHCAILFTPENIHTLAVAGWVPVKCGDQAMTFEPVDCKLGFIEIGIEDTDSSDKVPNAEKIRKDAQAFASAEVEHDYDLNPVKYSFAGSSSNHAGIGSETDGDAPTGKPKGSTKTTESRTIQEWGGYYCPKCKDKCVGVAKNNKYFCEKCGTEFPPRSSSLRSREVKSKAKEVAERLLDEMTAASAIPAVESPMLAGTVGAATRLKKSKSKRKFQQESTPETPGKYNEDDIDLDAFIAQGHSDHTVNVQSAMTADRFYHKTKRYSGRRSHEPLMVRRSGKTKTWKTRPGHFQIPVKYGMYEHGYITQDNANEWTTEPVATAETQKPAATKWKIQTSSANGWADVKTSVDGGPYRDDFYDTRQDAENERQSFPDPEAYRVVPSSTPQDDDIYDDEDV